MGLSTHILDTELGLPAMGVPLELAKFTGGAWEEVGAGITDTDGRCKTLLGDQNLQATMYRLRFATGEYYRAQKTNGLYPYVDIVFTVATPDEHYHIPLLLTSNGYSTYRGS
jgi:5-hydroxyisourate hydrolase